MDGADNTFHINYNAVISYLGGAGIVVTTLVSTLPVLAAVAALVWYGIQIYESATIQRWIANRRLKRIAKLKAAVLMLEAKSVPLPPGFDN